MKRVLEIANFKCFSEVEIPLNRLSVLCGSNASGKSTIIQALLLHRLAAESTDQLISVNGPMGLRLGETDQLLHRGSEDSESSDTFSVRLEEEQYEFKAAESSRILSVVMGSPMPLTGLPDFSYLSAERIGPRTIQEQFSNSNVRTGNVGASGEFAAETLLRRERERIRDELIPESLRTGSTVLLRSAVEGWLSAMFGAIEIEARPNGNAPPSLYFKRPGVTEDWFLASNTGFGLTYALPIILSGLLIESEGTMIVDSPEAHLHPAAQTAISRFLCRVAASGVNVIIETHSDYIIDGLRISITKPCDGELSRDDCTLLSVAIGIDGRREVTEIFINEHGKPSSWPPGFFDQQVQNIKAIVENTSKNRP